VIKNNLEENIVLPGIEKFNIRANVCCLIDTVQLQLDTVINYHRGGMLHIRSKEEKNLWR